MDSYYVPTSRRWLFRQRTCDRPRRTVDFKALRGRVTKARLGAGGRGLRHRPKECRTGGTEAATIFTSYFLSMTLHTSSLPAPPPASASA